MALLCGRYSTFLQEADAVAASLETNVASFSKTLQNTRLSLAEGLSGGSELHAPLSAVVDVQLFFFVHLFSGLLPLFELPPLVLLQLFRLRHSPSCFSTAMSSIRYFRFRCCRFTTDAVNPMPRAIIKLPPSILRRTRIMDLVGVLPYLTGKFFNHKVSQKFRPKESALASAFQAPSAGSCTGRVPFQPGGLVGAGPGAGRTW